MTFNIQQEIDNLIKREGGFVNDPDDHGGATNYGITQRTLTMYLGRECSTDDIKNLSKQTAKDIYYINYYIKPSINLLPDLIKPIVLDMAVNMGAGRSIKLLQTALENKGFDPGNIDGKIGSKTIAAANSAVDQLGNGLIKTLVTRRVIYYEGLVKQDESQRWFLAGWVNRAESFTPTESV